MEDQILKDIIMDTPFFAGLAPRHLEALANCASRAYFEEGAYILREDEPAQSFYLIRFGQVALTTYIPRRGIVTLQTLHEGDLLGWSWLFPPFKWHFDGRAKSMVRVVQFNAPAVLQLCDQDHELGYQLMRRFAGMVIQRLQISRLQMLDVFGQG